MKGKTHIAVGLASTTLITSWLITPAGLFSAILGSLWPDEDIDGSTISTRISGLFKDILFIGLGIYLINIFLKKQGISFTLPTIIADLKFQLSIKTEFGIAILVAVFIWSRILGHRRFSHSFLGLFVNSFGVWLIFPNIVQWFALGYVSHILIDLLNHKGEELLYPLHFKFCLGLCDAGKLVDNIICIICTIIFIIRLMIYFHIISI